MKSGQAMGDAAGSRPPFNLVRKRLYQEFVEKEYEGEPPESIATAYLDYVLKLMRTHRGVTAPGTQQDAVDCETIDTLKNAQLDDPHFVEAEATFRRLGIDPIRAFEYFDKLIKQKGNHLSKKMSNVAKQPRLKTRKIFSEAITEFVRREPNIAPKALQERFRSHEDFEIRDNVITHIVERDVMKVASLPQALYRNRKKMLKKKKPP